MLNKVILIGNLGKDPEVRSLPSGQPVPAASLPPISVTAAGAAATSTPLPNEPAA